MAKISGGADPGLKGCLIWADLSNRKILYAIKLSKRLLEKEPLELIELIQNAPCGDPEEWVIERQQRMKGRKGTAKGLQTMLVNYGTLLTILRIATPDTKIREFSPNAWKKKIGATADKELSLALASERFPKYDFKGDDNAAEAALLSTL